MANNSTNSGPDADTNATERAVERPMTRADLVTLIREMISDEIANEADILLSEGSGPWTPLSLIAAAERRYLEKNFGNLESFANQQMNSRIVVDVDGK